jgi:hypothetical protein
MKTMMKTAGIVATTFSLMLMQTPGAQAGDKEWAAAGKILTGVVAASVLTSAFCPSAHAPTVYATPAYASSTVVIPAPAVRVVRQPPVVVRQPVRQVVVQRPVQQVLVQQIPPPVMVYPAPVVYPAPWVARPYPPMIGFSFHIGASHRHLHHW